MIYGIGIDIVKIKRMEEASEKWGRRFFEKILTESEIEYCFKRNDPFPSLAVRFAAKEAFIKAMGSEIPVSMKDLEVENDEKGRPSLKLGDGPREFCRKKSITGCHLSLSHEKEFGVACVILER